MYRIEYMVRSVCISADITWRLSKIISRYKLQLLRNARHRAYAIFPPTYEEAVPFTVGTSRTPRTCQTFSVINKNFPTRFTKIGLIKLLLKKEKLIITKNMFFYTVTLRKEMKTS